ncbi:PREDICTED: agamous-like MADS-box protein AGL62 [Fragaria vesca subsp. vesca]|uniref:agamous-like MADS-box protein AGL62 n=1 Tax=Fragaria vesca subsp. vesca TaxID=101020 RepID=UPI0002C30056|nr:PREDICTED: agamous-like MADS-box protein AGL62 [Fragaria vesca subsp. vesca]
MGRRKIEIKKISNKNYLMTSFTKRRNGLFHKASQFCRLSGAEIAVIVFSPGGRVYLFGHPSADSVIDRYDIRTEDNNNEGTREFPYTIDDEEDDAHDDDMSSSELANEAADGKHELGKAGRFWWDNLPIEDMELKQLEQYKSCLEVLRNDLAYKLYDRKRRDSHTKDFLSLIGSSSSGIADMELKQHEQYKGCSSEVFRNEMAYELYETKRRESQTRDFLSLIGENHKPVIFLD